MVEVSDIVDKYKSNPKNVSRVSPILLFIMINATDITRDIPSIRGTRPNLKTRRNAFRDAYEKLEYTEKAKYIQAANDLGYTGRLANSNIESASSNLIARLNALREQRKLRRNPN